MLVLLVITLLASCDDGKGLIFGIMAVGAASGLWQATDDKPDDKKSDTASNSNPNTSPTASADFAIHSSQTYDGTSDDLLTAGLGQSGLSNTTTPTATDPSNPTAPEIRKATIFNQYKALQDMRPSLGYGTLYGPAAPTKFATSSSDGKIAGKEYLAYADDGSGNQNVTMMVQLPDNFDSENPCIVAAPSPGSRGVYGAISTVGEWGLKNHCAVAYTDKGTGSGVHDLTTGTVNLIDGTRKIATDAGKQANFRAQGTAELDLSSYSSTYPDRIAQKHAHSQQNPEANWGKNVLDTIQFAFQILNLEENFGKKSTQTENDDQAAASAKNQTTITATLTPANTIVIAAGISSGGAAALRAAEQDSNNWIDGVVVAAPLINVNFSKFRDAQGITIQQGNKPPLSYQNYNKSLFDVITYYNVFQPCASANTAMGLSERCKALRNAGWLSSNTLSEQVEAQKRLNDYGILESSNAIAHYYESASIYAGFAYGYASAYGRFSVVDNLCGYSYAYTQGNKSPSAKILADLADDFQSSSGMPPSSETQLINNNGNQDKGINFHQSQDGYLAGALCLRQLATGTTGITNTSVPLTGNQSKYYQRVQQGINETLASGDLRGKPAIIVHGRDDALAPVNFTSRAYYGLNQQTQGANSPLVYIEVKNAHHFDAFNEQYHIDTQISLYYYLSQSLDQMYDHLKKKTALPPSQVIPTQPTASLPAIASKENIKETCLITFDNRVLDIPDDEKC
ncbi:d--3-hydroxybutyrate oligomer hydrolase lipoprotein transmembrane [Thioploca ingrica]|uniref:D--3-hydroxybutyrate oligomer hydrolase lipoprotein transmembrane n=1 Tax=Thioploca ingrica TaxID=40754 RepID=A0A090BW68_9GAMM|nr:d--3-hydroxybutyrate oligomer hydrolase lipoprotein transmembrane [Thioploca ingrica]